MCAYDANVAEVDGMEGISPLLIPNTRFRPGIFKEDTQLSAFRVFPDSPLAILPLFLVHIRKSIYVCVGLYCMFAFFGQPINRILARNLMLSPS